VEKTLMVGMQIITVPMEISVVSPQKTQNKTTISSSPT
jgi:hypothetical protein